MEDYLINNTERLLKLEKDIELSNELPYIGLQNLKGIFLNGLSTNLIKCKNAELKENILNDALRKIVVAKKFVNSNINDFYLKKTLLNSYNGLYREIESTYEANYPDIFVIEDIRSLNNVPKKYSGYDNLIGRALDFEKEPDKFSTEVFLDRSEIINKLIGLNTKKHDKFLEYEKKLISLGYLNSDRNKWLKGTASFIRFYIYCEKKSIIKEDIYRENSKGVKLLRDLYNYYDKQTIDTPKKRNKQITPRTRIEFNFLDII